MQFQDNGFHTVELIRVIGKEQKHNLYDFGYLTILRQKATDDVVYYFIKQKQ